MEGQLDRTKYQITQKTDEFTKAIKDNDDLSQEIRNLKEELRGSESVVREKENLTNVLSR